MMRGVAALGAAGVAVGWAGCRARPAESGASPPALPGPPGAASASDARSPSAWELVYEREVSGNLDLYVVPAGGGPERRLTDHPAGDMLGRWSPDGRAVVFSSERSGNWQLCEVPAAGASPRPLRTKAAPQVPSAPPPARPHIR